MGCGKSKVYRCQECECWSIRTLLAFTHYYIFDNKLKVAFNQFIIIQCTFQNST